LKHPKWNEEAKRLVGTETETSVSEPKRPAMSENPDDYVRVGDKLRCRNCNEQFDLYECSCGIFGTKAFVLRHLRGRYAKNEQGAYDVHVLVTPDPQTLIAEGSDAAIIGVILKRAEAGGSPPLTPKEGAEASRPFSQDVVAALLEEKIKNDRRLAAELKEFGESRKQMTGPKEIRVPQHKKGSR
jgi:hypothetical protein